MTLSVIFCPTYVEQKQQMNQSEVEKLEQAIEVHGYRGTSKQKRNGIVNIKATDTQLWKAYNKFLEINKPFILQHCDCNSTTNNTIAVKIVAHITNGNRAIGILYQQDQKLFLLGFANYQGKLK